MCTLITLHRPGTAWPLLLAANRDEALDRPWLPPDRHWQDQPDVIGGLDVLAGGTWLALNTATGVAAAVLNRTGSLGPAPGKASRGQLPLQALRHPSAPAAAAAMRGLDAGLWRSFNLVIADSGGVFWVQGGGSGHVAVIRLADGLHMVTSADPDDASHPRIARHRPRFASAEAPDPPDWRAWPALLADAEGPPEASLNIRPIRGFGTASSALIGLSAGAIAFDFASGPPDSAAFAPVAMRATLGSTGMA
jgi:uncharacterized protein with NRDE domain